MKMKGRKKIQENDERDMTQAKLFNLLYVVEQLNSFNQKSLSISYI